jgi:3-deoxy-7-phosphoheptulonate synthase
MKKIKKPSEILKVLPLSDDLKQRVEKDREEIKKIISGEDSRKILIIGPCSA